MLPIRKRGSGCEQTRDMRNAERTPVPWSSQMVDTSSLALPSLPPASLTVPSIALPSGSFALPSGSFAVPSFSFPSEDKDLEARLPNELNGVALKK